MNKEQVLSHMGLSDLEAATYLSLLKLGGSQASVIAKDLGIKRTTIYDVLSSLAKQGFATVYFKKNKRLYYAQKPQRVAHVFEEKLRAFTDLIPQLQSIEKKQAQSLGLRFIQTTEELEQFYQDVLRKYKGQSYDIIGSAPAWEGMAEEFFIKFRHDRARAKIKTRLLLTAESKRMNPTDPTLSRDYRYLPEGYQFHSTIDIYADQVLIVTREISVLGVVIEIPVMVDIFKSIFDVLWSFVPPIENNKK